MNNILEELSIDAEQMKQNSKGFTIPFNKPYISGREFEYMRLAVDRGKISGNGFYTKKCHELLEDRYGFKKCLLTTSCTDALEMASILMNLKVGDEVIVPSFTFVSTANAFVRSGAKIIFADCEEDQPNVSAQEIERLISPRTKAIVVVHYAGIACDMDAVMELSRKHNLFVVEDAAQAINSYYRDTPLGSIGHLAAFSFHETKNISCGEGGVLVINDESLIERAEIVWEKGTNRVSFSRGEVDKYAWVDLGSSFLPSELNAAFLFAQLESLDDVQQKRSEIWNRYMKGLKNYANESSFSLPKIPKVASNNAHIFYLVLQENVDREEFLSFLESRGVQVVFHYLPLHSSPYFKAQYVGKELFNCDRFSDKLVRLPLYTDMTDYQVDLVLGEVNNYFEQ